MKTINLTDYEFKCPHCNIKINTSKKPKVYLLSGTLKEEHTRKAGWFKKVNEESICSVFSKGIECPICKEIIRFGNYWIKPDGNKYFPWIPSKVENIKIEKEDKK